MACRPAVVLCALLLTPALFAFRDEPHVASPPIDSVSPAAREAITFQTPSVAPAANQPPPVVAPAAVLTTTPAETPDSSLPVAASPEAAQPAPPVAEQTTAPASDDGAPAAAPGKALLANNQMVVFYGSPLSPDLGVLGQFDPAEAARRVRDQARIYDEINGDRGVVPAFDLIYAQAQAEPTDNGLFLRYLEDDVVWRYIAMAEAFDLQLILDLQIGRGSIVDEVRKTERFLRNPRVHIAIDPEYAVGPWGAPAATPGSMSGRDINQVQDYLSGLVDRENLPPKLVIIHQYMDDTIIDGDVTHDEPDVEVVLNMDAFGEVKEKQKKYRKQSANKYAEKNSFNIFLQYDERVLSEQEVLDLIPLPDVVFYQ